jgi:hypothetical protein
LLIAGGYGAHVFEDQLGHMGCNLGWPLTRQRTPGLGWLHAADITPNVLVSWTALIAVFLNLDRFSSSGKRFIEVWAGLGLLIFPWLLALGWAFRAQLRGWIIEMLSALADRS